MLKQTHHQKPKNQRVTRGKKAESMRRPRAETKHRTGKWAKEILKKHGFPFGVSSVLGEGSMFWFEMKMLGEEDSEE